MFIKFNKALYKTRAIKSAIKEYGNLAEFSLEQKGQYIVVEFKNIDKDVKNIIKDEFCNYVLSQLR